MIMGNRECGREETTRGLGWLNPHGICPVVLTAQKEVAWLSLNIVASVNVSFAVNLATATSQAALSLSSIPVLMWITNGVCDEHQNVFLLKPGCWTTPGRKEVESFFGLWDFKEDDSWQMHHYWWPLVLFEDLDWIGGWCSSTTCHLSPSQKTAERGPEVVRRVDKKLCPSFSLSHIFYLISALLLENSCLFDKGFHSGRVIGAHVGSHGTGWSAHCSRKVRRFSCFIFLPGSRMTWPTVNLDSWNPQTSTLFFLCVLCSFALLWSFYWVEELYQSCLPAGEINKNPTELIPACWCIPPWDPSPAYLPHSLFSFILFLSG